MNLPTTMNVPTTRRWVLGVDGGGTKTVAQIATFAGDSAPSTASLNLRVYATGTSGPSNPNRVGWDVALENLQDAITQALAQVATRSISAADIQASCIAVSGVGTEADRNQLRQWVQQFDWGQQSIVTDDGRVILQAITSGQVPYAVALISGTGTLAIGSNANGRVCRSGGWGEQWGDEGSGQWLATAALRQVTRWMDRRADGDEFSAAILDHLQLTDDDSFRLWLRRVQPESPVLRELAPLVQRLADAGNPTAIALRNQAVMALVELVTSVLNQLEYDARHEAEPIQLALTGGWLTSDEQLSNQLLAQLSDSVGSLFEVHEFKEPVDCAIQCALRVAIERA